MRGPSKRWAVKLSEIAVLVVKRVSEMIMTTGDTCPEESVSGEVVAARKCERVSRKDSRAVDDRMNVLGNSSNSVTFRLSAFVAATSGASETLVVSPLPLNISRHPNLPLRPKKSSNWADIETNLSDERSEPIGFLHSVMPKPITGPRREIVVVLPVPEGPFRMRSFFAIVSIIEGPDVQQDNTPSEIYAQTHVLTMFEHPQLSSYVPPIPRDLWVHISLPMVFRPHLSLLVSRPP